jgi:4'-phosphopantetheinyl transferase EntD
MSPEWQLLSEEQAIAQSFSSAKRRREFVAGRRRARQALAGLGIMDFALLPGDDRAPIWPSGVVGSITHTEAAGQSYCAVAVARRQDLDAIGIDAEAREGLPPDLWERVLDQGEQREALRAPEPGVQARLVFSAKESVFKALYPQFKCFLDFPDVHVDCGADGAFSAELRGAARDLTVPSTKLLGRFVIEQTMILTGLALAAGSLQRARQGTSQWHDPS